MWEKWRLRDNPYSPNPITECSLELFVGREQEVRLCNNGLATHNSKIVIEGGRGVGTTSLGNYVRYRMLEGHGYLTPDLEIAVGPNWNLELLLSNVLSAVVYALDGRHPEVRANGSFQEVRRATQLIEERFKTLGAQVLGFGAQYGQSAALASPSVVPAMTLMQYMKAMAALSGELGYGNGIIVHINNLDVGTVFQPDDLRSFLNESRDAFQLDGYDWLLIGDLGLRGFIGSHVDRLDDIVTAEARLEPLSLDDVRLLIDRRMSWYGLPKGKTLPPIDFEVIEYLYHLTNGRLRYIFGLCTRLLSILSTEAVIQTVDLGFARPVIASLAEDRIIQRNLTPLSLTVLQRLVREGPATTSALSKALKKGQTSVSRSLSELLGKRLVRVEKIGRNNVYSPSLDAKVAYS